MTRFAPPTRRLSGLVLALAGIGLTAAACESSEALPASGTATASVPSSQVATRFAQERPAQAPPQVAEGAAGLDDSRRTAIVRASDRVAPAVVTVSTLRTETVQNSFGFFNLGPQQRRSGGYGSGFVIDGDEGIILTNDHVINGAEQIQVTLADGTDLEAELVGSDEVTDVAVLRVNAGRPLAEAPLGTSQDLLIGEWALAVGNPFGVEVSNSEPTVTAGVVSATGRHIVPSENDQSFYLGMIQTDAAINPGNSGGPLVNALGQVIGINSSIFSRSGGSEGLGFAIPIDRALRVAEDLLATGGVRRAWLGIQVDGADTDPWGRARGVMITEVFGDSPAREAGVRPGRTILTANGRRLAGPLDWEDVILDLREGDPLQLEVEGEGTVSLVTAPYPSTQAMRVQVVDDLDVISVTPQIRAERQLALDQGALVVGITDELRRITGLQEEDVIYAIRGRGFERRIETADDLVDVFREFDRVSGSIQFQIFFARGRFQRSATLSYNGRGGSSGSGDTGPTH